MTSSSIRDFMIQYKQGLDAGDIEYKDAEFERVAEIFKRYDKYETFNKESKDAIDGLRKDVDMYLSERSSDKESVQNAYKLIFMEILRLVIFLSRSKISTLLTWKRPSIK